MQSGSNVPLGMQLVGGPCRTNDFQFEQFVRGLDAVLSQWTALHLVGRFCDPFALPSLRDELVQWFREDGEVYSDDLEVYFEGFFDTVRSVSIEDDSPKEVGDVLHRMYCQCSRGDFSSVEHFIGTLEVYKRLNPVQASINACGNPVGDDDDDDDDADENEADENEAGHNGAQHGGSGHQGLENLDESAPKQQQQQKQQQQPPKPKKKTHGKNQYKKGSDGWCIVER